MERILLRRQHRLNPWSHWPSFLAMRPIILFGARSWKIFTGSRIRIWPSMGLCNNGHRAEENSKDNDEKFDLGHLHDDRQTQNLKDQGEKSNLGHLPDESNIESSPNKEESQELSGHTEDSDERFGLEQLPQETLLKFSPEGAGDDFDEFNTRRRVLEGVKSEANRVLQILRQDGPGFDARTALEELKLKISHALVREVLLRILMSINGANRSRYAKLAYKFFVWSGEQEGYKHTANTYNLTIKIFAESAELKAMWRLVDEMTKNGLPITARTFNILICSCGEAGMVRKLVERFIKSKTFNYRPFKHSFNAILHSLLTMNQFRLIEWVYQKMLLEGHSPDVLTYNVIMRAKYMLGKLDQFHRLLDEMGKNGFAPDLHTYNLLLHVLGKGDKPLAALNLLDYMNDVGYSPSVLHFTTLIDGLSRARNLEACKYFFDEMVKKGCEPDVICYTVMITGYVVAGQFEKAQQLFDDMLMKGQLPNVFTYNSMIRGLCIVGKFDEACSMLKDMDRKGCTPNFSVYSTLVGRLRNAGKVSEANNIISYMVEKGHYLHMLSRFKGYRRC